MGIKLLRALVYLTRAIQITVSFLINVSIYCIIDYIFGSLRIIIRAYHKNEVNLFVPYKFRSYQLQQIIFCNELPILMIRKAYARILSIPKLPDYDYQPEPYSGPSYQQVIRDRSEYMNNLYTHYYKEPLLVVEGRAQYLWDHLGKRYLDMISGISTVNVGHCHPRITKVIQDQAAKLVHTTSIYMNQYQGEYSKMLCQSLGQEYDTVFLTNSGSEANDMAVMLAKHYTKGTKTLTLKNSYHGLAGICKPTNQKDTINNYKLTNPTGQNQTNKILDESFREIQSVLRSNQTEKVACFITEPILGFGGITPLPEGYMNNIFDIVRSHGGLCISDEVQTGFGRLGKQMWGFKWQKAKPDIVTLAKAIGNGYPMGAVVTRKQIAKQMKRIFNTFGGGPIQCRIGMEVLKILREERLPQNADRVGDYLLKRLKAVQKKSKILGDVRGKGLMIGLEILQDKVSKTASPVKLNELMEGARKMGLLIGKSGTHQNIIRLQPPLNITMEDASFAADVLEQLLVSTE